MNEQDRNRFDRLEDSLVASMGSLEERIERGTDRIMTAVERINGDVRDNSERISAIEGARDSERFTSRKAGLAGGSLVAVVVGILEVLRRYLESGA